MNSGNKNDEAVERKVDKLNYKEAQHNLRIAKFYEKTRKLKSALVYYKEVSNTNFKNLKKYADSRISVLEKNPINSQ